MADESPKVREGGEIWSLGVKGRERRPGTGSEWLGLATTVGTDAGVEGEGE